MTRPTFNRRALSWAFYDWGNSAFATTVMAGFFPVFFKQYWNDPSDPSLSTFRLGVAHTIASLVMLVASPLLGAIADAGGRRRGLLAFFTFLGCLATLSLSFVDQGEWLWAAAFFVVGNIGFAGGCLFYDSMLIDIAQPKERDRVSALGYALGYLGGGLLFALNVLMSQKPHWFGFTSAATAVRASFASVAIWWALFSIPVLRLQERQTARFPWKRAISTGVRDLWTTTRSLRRLPMTSLFLASFWLYMDGVDTVIRMALDYGLSLGLQSSQLITALLVTQFVGFPAALVFGKVGDRWGAKSGILFCIGVYCLAVMGAYGMRQASDFYALAVTIGLVQGGIQSLSRSLYSRLIPADRPSEFFGFYNMMGKFAAVLGPLLMGVTAHFTGSARASILSVLSLFLLGGLLLLAVDEKRATREARAWSHGEQSQNT